MMKRMFLGLVVLAALTHYAHAEVAVGKPAADFTLTDVTGKQHSLADYKGKLVVLEWFNYDCPFVKKHYGTGNMQKLQKEYTDEGVIWLSINSSAEGKQGNYSPEVMQQMAQERSVASTAVLLDTDGKVGRAFGAKTTPHMFVLDKEGTVIYQGAIDDKPTASAEDVPMAVNYVVQAIESAMIGNPVVTQSTQSYGCGVKYAD